ncbi:MAG: 4Fe-4S binding protein [Bacteroidales bacterium]|nr:4Fe-4S binding protein [Bacteroidales bacterium]
MSNTLLISLAVLGILGGILAVVLYIVAQKFKVEENPLIDEAEACLPGANCGGCGFAGCRALAEACVKQAAEKGNIDGLACPGTDMGKVAAVLGLTAGTFEPKIAVVRCNGSCQNSPAKVHYEGADICAFANTLYAGEGGCSKGCLGLGDCVKKCNFDALHIDKETGLPVVDPDKCVGCGVCAKTCPRGIIEVRPRGKKDRRVYVCCVNTDKGALVVKNCSVGCIGCQKCLKECPFEAIEMRGNLAYIDPAKCKACGKCAKVCPRGTIHAINFPAPKPEAPALQGAEPAVKPQPKPEAQPVEVKTEVKPENTVTA